jgi:hypothetical protein
MTFIESMTEQAAMNWLKDNLGYDYAFGPEIAFSRGEKWVNPLGEGLIFP